MRKLLSITRSARAIAVLAIAASVVAAAPAAASPKPVKQFMNYCAFKDRPVTQMTNVRNELVLLCVINRARVANGVAPLHLNTALENSAGAHADRSVSLRWWDYNDGFASHVDPQTGTHPADRIKAAGYCPGGTIDPNENTFAAYGNGQYMATASGAVNWWLSDPPHRATLLSTQYRDVGPAARAGLAFPGQSFDPAGTFVVDFGSCN